MGYDELIRIISPSATDAARAMTKDITEIVSIIPSRTEVDGARIETITFKSHGHLTRRYSDAGEPLSFEAQGVKFERCGYEIFGCQA
jgi:hypothetical protein